MTEAALTLRTFHLQSDQLVELPQLPNELPAKGFVWIGLVRSALESALPDLQAALQRWTNGQLVDLHVSDLLNTQLPSHFDYTSWYDVLVFRRLVAVGKADSAEAATPKRTVEAIDTSPVGFAVFDRVLVSVHPGECMVREFFAQRLSQLGQGTDMRGVSRMPTSTADLMLRMVNYMVDSYLELRRVLTR
jgi:magnesium transporter